MFSLKIVTPFGEFCNTEAKRVIARAVEGDMAILKNTAAITTPLAIGTIRVLTADEEEEITVSGGYMSNEDNQLTIVTEAAEWTSEIDVERAEAARKRAEERLRKGDPDLDIRRAELALARALNRINHSR